MYLVKIFLFLIVALCADICSFGIWSYPFLQMVLCSYLVLLYQPSSLLPLCISAFFISLESLLYYDRFGGEFIYLFPLTLLIVATNHALQLRTVMPYVFLAIARVAQSIVIERFVLQLPSAYGSAIGSFFVNCLVIFALQKWVITRPQPSRGAMSR